MVEIFYNYLMDDLLSYIVKNFIVLCVAIILITILIMKMKKHKTISIYLILILSLTVLITIFDYLQIYAATSLKNVMLTTALAATLYVLRPTLVLLFILLSGQKIKNIWFYLLLIPLGINIIVNILPFIPATGKLVYYYETSSYDTSGGLHWNGGTALRFTPHIVSVIYLVYLVYRSISLLKIKHFLDAIGIISCVAVVSAAIIIETFFNPNGLIYLLPSSTAISAIFYYLFLYERDNKMDPLTGLFNRASYYEDVIKLNKEITGVIQLDMNGLKYLNDTYGHLEGDKGLIFVAQIISNHASSKMYSYRVGGDEFVVLVINDHEEDIVRFIRAFKEDIKDSGYYCSVGYAVKSEKANNYDELIKLAEENMYKDKAEFYKTATFERRKTTYINNNKQQND